MHHIVFMEGKYSAEIMILMILILAPVVNAEISINEIMYDAKGSDANNEWLEIYSNESAEINFTKGKLFEDGTNHALAVVLGSGIIPAGGYAVIAENASAFRLSYPDYTGALFDSTFSLSNTNETIAIKDAGGMILDTILYLSAWGANGNGKTLERSAAGWFESAAIGGTPCAENSIFSYSAPPTQTIQNQTNEATNETQNITEETDPPPMEITPDDASDTEADNSTPQIQQSSAPSSIEIIGTAETLKFGDYSSVRARFSSGSANFQKVRFVAYIYKPSWIARDINTNGTTLRNSPYNSNAAAEISEISANETHYLVLPIFLKCNTGGYANTTYTARVRAYSFENDEWKTLVENDRDIFVSGESDACKKEKETAKQTVCVNKTIEKNCSEKITMLREGALEINATYPEIVFQGENFTTTVYVKNSGGTLRDIEIYSYMYEHSTIISSGFNGEKWGNARTANSKKVTLYSGNSTTIELINRARENTTAEKYTYKISFDDLNDDKKSEERIYLIELKARNASETNGVSDGTKNDALSNSTEAKNKITGNLLAEKTKLQNLSFLDRIIYKIKSWLM